MSEGFKGMQWEYNKTNFDRNLAVVIGIDRYNSDRIHNLSTPVSDARALADLLESMNINLKMSFACSTKTPR